MLSITYILTNVLLLKSTPNSPLTLHLGLTEMWGTPTHYSPELINKTYGPQSDIWSLGCMLFEMLTGEEAFPS